MNENPNSQENAYGQQPQHPEQQPAPPPPYVSGQPQPPEQAAGAEGQIPPPEAPQADVPAPYQAPQPEAPAPFGTDQPVAPAPYDTQAPAEGAYSQTQQPVDPNAPYAQPADPNAPYAQQPADPNSPYAQQPVSPYEQPYPPTATAAAPGSGKAVASLVCGILAILFSWTIIVGVILGIVAIALAASYVKQFGKESKATGGKITGIVGIVFSVLTLIISLVFFFAILSVVDEYNATSGSGSGSLPSASNTYSNSGSTEDQEGVKQVVSSAMDSIKNPDQARIDSLAQYMDEDFYDMTDLHLSDVGVDAKEYAKKVANSVSYSVESVYVSGETATAYVEVYSIDVLSASLDFYDLAEAAYDAGDLNLDTPTDADRTKVGDYYKESIDKGEPSEKYVSMNCTKTNGKWAVDQSSLDSVAQRCYGVYGI